MAKLVGPAKRAKDKAARIEKRKKLGKQALKQFVPKFFHTPCIADGFEESWIEVQQELLSLTSNKLEYQSSLNYLIEFVISVARKNKLDIKLPAAPIRVKRSKPMKTLTWQQCSNVVCETHQAWMESLITSTDALKGDDLYTAFISSALFHSGLATPEELFSLIQVLDETTPLQRWNSLFYVEFMHDSNRFNSNVYIEKEALTLKRLYLSPVTVLLFNNVRKRKQLGEKWRVPPKTIKELWHKIIQYFSRFGRIKKVFSEGVQNINSIPVHFSHFCKAALSVTEFGKGISLPQALIEYCDGRNRSYSLQTYNQRFLITPNIKRINTTMLGANIINLPNNKDYSVLSKSRVQIDLYTNLLKATAELDKQGNMRSKEHAVASFRELLASNLAEHQYRVVHWLYHVAKGNAVSTVRRYLGTFVIQWLGYTEGLNLDEMDESEYLNLYTTIIEETLTEKSKSYNAAQLQQFHLHCHRHFSAPILDEPIPYANSKIRQHSHAGFIGETLFQQLLISIANFTDLNDQQKLMYQCYVIMMYRCGLRPHEVLKLHIDDFDISSNRWLRVVPKKNETNKSLSADRKLPLIDMLVNNTDSERKHVSEYAVVTSLLRQRKASSGNRNTPIFFNGHNSKNKLRQSNLNRVLKALLVSLSGDHNLITYHLRHSCLSRLQFVFHHDLLTPQINSGELKEILPYDLEKCKQLKNLLGNQGKRDIYWAMASFAGHSSPEVTFNSYFHFSDMLVGYIVNNRCDKYPIELIHNLSGLSKNQLVKEFGKNALIEVNALAPMLHEANKRITKLPPKIKTYKPILINSNTRKININTCYEVLSQYQKGMLVEDIISIYHITNEEIEKWMNNATYIAGRLTLRNNSRVNPINYAKRLLPSPLKSKEERDFFERFISELGKRYKGKKNTVQRTEIKWAFEYFLSHHAMHHGVYFNKPSELERFIRAFKHCIGKVNWQVKTRHTEYHKNSKHWDEVTQDIACKPFVSSSPNGRDGHGAVYLKIRHPSKNGHTTPLLTYMLRMAIIMMGEIKEAEDNT